MGKENSNKIAIIFGEGIGREILPKIAKLFPNLSNDVELSVFNKKINKNSFKDLIDYSKFNLNQNIPIICGPISGKYIYEYRRELDLLIKTINIKSRNSKIFYDPSVDIDFLIIRENNSGLFNGLHGSRRNFNSKSVHQVIEYSNNHLKNILLKVKDIASARSRKVSFFTKSYGLFEIHNEVNLLAKKIFGHDIKFESINIDFALSDLINNPNHYDVIFTLDFMGDIITDVLVNLFYGSREAGYSVNYNSKDQMIYQTISGSAIDITNKNIANPIGYLNIFADLNTKYRFKNGDKFLERLNVLRKINSNFDTKNIIEQAFDL